MCLVTVAVGVSARYPLVLAANRDELHARPTVAAGWWDDHPHILGGRDLVAGGTWLAVDRAGRIAAVTNLRERPPRRWPRSRGWLVREFLSGAAGAGEFVHALQGQGSEYGAFNLLLKDGDGLHYASNRAADVSLAPGIHVLGNARLGTAWPKIEAAERGTRAALALDDPTEALLDLLAIREARGDAGGGDDAERFDRYARALFIDDPDYGTRSSTVILVSADDEVTFVERRFGATASAVGESRYTFGLEK